MEAEKTRGRSRVAVATARAIRCTPPYPWGLSHGHKPRPEHQPVTDDRHRVWLPRPGVACQPPLAAFPVGDLRRVLAEDHPVEALLANFRSVAHGGSPIGPGCAPFADITWIS